ncbi:ABC transporter permease [Microtetraspora sp. AC03309]|uniref:ABC transporter permease n=1 Tax=Microtetraspora sp. AC03309 TaxID=2779376 RepID=UPI001E3F8B32|nr:ABC transporter permease [Microtetraspora sp. AC03309]MCC5581721.1 ABC transporter permease [Microtetraspora sp. AC03309]
MSAFMERLTGRVKLDGVFAIVAPVLAVVFAGLVTSVVLLIAGNSPADAFTTLLDQGSTPRIIVLILNTSAAYYLSAVAVAIGFRMNLFNIGVDGQYRLAALLAAAVGGAGLLPGVLNSLLVVLVAVLVGALWASIAGLLKVTRGVSEVISTIMLNAIATGLTGWLLTADRLGVLSGNAIGTTPIPEDAHAPGWALIPGTPMQVNSFLIVAIIVGVGYAVLLNRTRFGFNLRATGRSEPAAVASGVDVKRMVISAMVISGAVAGLVGMPELLGGSFQYSLNFPAGLGFTGIAIALLGRNNAVGMAVGALLWAFLDSSSNALQILDISKELVDIMKGVIVLSVIIAYELVHRYRTVAAQHRVSRELAAPAEVEGAAV